MKTSHPKIIIIAGPNGAGKTTFAKEFLPNEAGCPIFINADLIAAGIAPFHPETAAFRAGKMMLQEIENCVKKKISFAFETTLSGLTYLHQIKKWKKFGYTIKIIFLALDSADTAIARVNDRVKQGGHFIPESVIRRRFAAGRKNFEEKYALLADAWALYNNTGKGPVLMKRGENNEIK